MSTRILFFLTLISVLLASVSSGYIDNSKFLGNDLAEEERRLGRRRRPGYQGSTPCNFGSGGYRRPKNEGTGRTFFDLQYFNVEHNYNFNINCGGPGGGGGGSSVYPVHPAPVHETHETQQDHGSHKPIGLGGHKPHKPGKPGGGGFFGNHGGGGLFGGLFGGGGNKPNKPHGGGPFNHGEGEGEHPSSGSGGPGNGVFSGAFAGILPSPSQFASGLSEGLQSFIGTIPAIGQSFQSILPTWDNFQLPQLPQFNPGADTGPVTFGPLFQGIGSFTNNFNRPPSIAPPITTTPSIVTTKSPTTTTDPDDIIYSDEIKPVQEDYDPITDPYNSNNRRPGGNRHRSEFRGRSLHQDHHSGHYDSDRNIHPSSFRSRNTEYDSHTSRSKSEGRSFRFPS